MNFLMNLNIPPWCLEYIFGGVCFRLSTYILSLVYLEVEGCDELHSFKTMQMPMKKTMCLALFCLKWGKGFAKNGRENIKEVVKRRFQWNVSQHKNENALIYCNCIYIYIYTLKILNTQTEWNTIVYSVYCSNLKVKQNHTMSQLWDLTGQVHHKHAKQICLKVKCMCQSLWHAMLYVTEIMKAAIYHDATSVIISIVHCPRAKQWCPLRTHADLCQI